MAFDLCRKIYEIDLSLPENDRWQCVIDREKSIAKKVCKEALKELEPVPKAARWLFGKSYAAFGGRYVDEMGAWATALGVSQADITTMQCSYEFAHLGNHVGRLSARFGCTAGIHQIAGLGMVHTRSMDWPMRCGGPATSIFKFCKGRRCFYTVGMVGMVGVLSGMLPHSYSVTINWAEPYSMPNPRAFGPLFLAREVLETCDTYEDAVHALRKTEIASPVFYVVCGAKNGQGCVIERTQSSSCLRSWTGDPLVQGNHYVSQRFKKHNAPIQEVDDDSMSLLEDSTCRVDAMAQLLADQRRPATLSGLSSVLRKQPVRCEDTVHQMAFHPKTGTLRVWARR